MQDTSNFNGVGFRLLYSAHSKILSIHYLTTNPFSLTDNKKPQLELNNFVEQQALLSVEDYMAPGVFLQRNKHQV